MTRNRVNRMDKPGEMENSPSTNPHRSGDNPIPIESLQKVPLSYASCSIGWSQADTLPGKLEAISNAGFQGIELAFPDIIDFASRSLGHSVAPENYAELVHAAPEIRKLCETNKLKIMMLQPFANFEGWPKGSIEREDAFARANGWIEIMHVVGTDMLQVRFRAFLLGLFPSVQVAGHA